MKRNLCLAIAAAAALSCAAGEARAQFGGGFYPGGFGGFGWGGWGGGESVYGANMRGLGAFAAGAGMYNQQTAVANSINAQTVTQWNEYLYQSQKEANRRHFENLARQQERTRTTGNAVRDRVRNNPTQRDILQGDTLNALLDEIVAPDAYDSTMKIARMPVKGSAVREVPFIYASAPIAFSIESLTEEGDWPPLLREARFEADRQAYRKAIADAIAKVGGNGQLTQADVDAAIAPLKSIRDKLLADPPKDPIVISQVRTYMQTLAAMTRMLGRPDFERVLAELERIEETTVGDMISFMHTFNLRFGPARTERQREIYLQRVFPILSQLANQQAQTRVAAKDAGGMDQPPMGVFNAMPEPTIYEGKHVPPAPQPK